MKKYNKYGHHRKKKWRNNTIQFIIDFVSNRKKEGTGVSIRLMDKNGKLVWPPQIHQFQMPSYEFTREEIRDRMMSLKMGDAGEILSHDSNMNPKFIKSEVHNG